jgi:hypothetical protein
LRRTARRFCRTKQSALLPGRFVQQKPCGPELVRSFTTINDNKPARKEFDMSNDQGGALLAGLGIVAVLVALCFALVIYVFSCFCCKRICEKCGVTPGVLVWIPIVQLVPLLEVAKMPVWMIILFLVPLANLVVFFMMWAKICVARGQSGWLVLLFLVPIANLVLIPYLAFSK